jgi:predicted Zn-dependent peptidase
MRLFLTTLASLSLAACAHAPAPVPPVSIIPLAAATPRPAPAQPAPLSQLVAAVDIPYETFTLANGLTVIVHTDRKAPVVGVTTYYRVGSKHEPRGKTGFAHLFEHLMFTGSENVPNFDIPLEAAGSTPTNGTTSYDRTNYVEVVPTGALDRALMMESDRMGHLLGAVDQAKLNKQRGVVQNEKRQSDNQPYGLVEYATGEGLFPVGHPYRHAIIGSMADLDAASLADVRQWFTDNYGPNNVVLALTGDIDAATARPMVERWFGAIPAGPAVRKVEAAPVTLPAPVKREMTDRVATTRIIRTWSGPALDDPDRVQLEIGLLILGGLSSSRLDNALVRRQQLAVSVSASLSALEQVSLLTAQMDVKPGVERAAAEAAFNAEIDRLVTDGPNPDEVQRAATRAIAGEIAGLERVGDLGGKGSTLAEGMLYRGDPAAYKADLAAVAAVTPQQVRAALQKWLGRPPFDLAVVPGERTEQGDAMGGWGDEGTVLPVKPAKPTKAPPLARGPKRAIPPIAPVADLALVPVEHATLSNGIPVQLMRRTAVPKVMVSLEFDAGYSADRHDRQGLQSLMAEMLEEGTLSRSSIAIAEEQERLGAAISTGASLDATVITLDALKPNLAPSLELMADVVRNPAFATEVVARVKDQRLAAIAQNLSSPYGLAAEVLNPAIFGPAHPYGVPAGGLGSAKVIAALDEDDLRAEHRRWLRPDLAALTVVGDTTLDEVMPQLEQAFGDWGMPASAPPFKNLDAPVPPPAPRLIMIDRPGSGQSLIAAGKVLPIKGSDRGVAVDLANEVIGSGFLSRLNMDLREDKGWTYGVGSHVRRNAGPRTFTVQTAVQADRTGDALRLLIAEMKAFPAKKPVEPGELERVTDGNIRGLPNRYETNAQMLSAMITNRRLGRPDDWDAGLASRYREVTGGMIDAAAKEYLQPGDMVFVVVGDRKVIEPQFKGLSLPVEYVTVDSGVDND